MTNEAGEAAVHISEPTRPDDAISTSAALKMPGEPAWNDQNGVDRYAAAEEASWWWPGYLASTLTGWTLNAVNSCFCDKCKCHFSSSLAVLQHLRDSYKHLATVEALEAKGSLYVYDQMLPRTYASDCYQLDVYNQGQYNQPLIPSFQPGATLVDDGEKLTCEQLTSSTNRSTSPVQGVEPPSSDIFTASSEMSEQDNLKQQEQDQRQWRQRYKGKQQQGRYGDAVRAQKPQRQPMRAGPLPPPSTEKYEAAFPTLGGGMPPAPVRRWTPAAATRKLRVDAPEWAPGCPVTSFALLSVKARQAQPAPEAATPETADIAKAAESPRSSSAAAPEAASASPQAAGGRPKQEHKQRKQEQRPKQKAKEREAGVKEQAQQGGAATTECVKEQGDDKAAAAGPATPPAAPPAMSWRSVVARNTPIVPPAAPAAAATAAAAAAPPPTASKQKDGDAGREGRW